LDPIVPSVTDVYETVLRDGDAVYGVKLLRRRPCRIVCINLTIVRFVAVRAPMPFILSGIPIEDDDAAIIVTIGNIDFVRGRILVDLGWSPEVLRVVAPVMLALMTYLQEELPSPVELQNLRVRASLGANPDVLLGVDRDAMVALRPFVTLARAAPVADEIPCLIKF
jgi:hypothetical protein